MRTVLLFCLTITLLLTCACINEGEQEAPSSREATINWLEEDQGLKNPQLIFGKYSLLVCVLDTSYTIDDEFDAENPDGYATGQSIDVLIIDDVACSGGTCRKGEVIEGIFSHGGDTSIVGKPEAGDLVGHRLGYYASIWEKIDLAQLCQSTPYLE